MAFVLILDMYFSLAKIKTSNNEKYFVFLFGDNVFFHCHHNQEKHPILLLGNNVFFIMIIIIVATFVVIVVDIIKFFF